MHKHTHSLYPSPPPIHTRASSRIHPHRLFTLDPLLFTGHLPGLGLWGNPGCIHPHRLFTPNPRAFTGHLPGPIYSHPTLSHSQAIFQGLSIHTRPSRIHRPSSRAHLFTPDPLLFTGHLPGCDGLGLIVNRRIHPRRLFTPDPLSFTGHLPGRDGRGADRHARDCAHQGRHRLQRGASIFETIYIYIYMCVCIYIYICI